MKRLPRWLTFVALLLIAGNCWAANDKDKDKDKDTVVAPEIHPAGAVAVATLLTGAFALITSRRRRA